MESPSYRNCRKVVVGTRFRNEGHSFCMENLQNNRQVVRRDRHAEASKDCGHLVPGQGSQHYHTLGRRSENEYGTSARPLLRKRIEEQGAMGECCHTIEKLLHARVCGNRIVSGEARQV